MRRLGGRASQLSPGCGRFAQSCALATAMFRGEASEKVFTNGTDDGRPIVFLAPGHESSVRAITRAAGASPQTAWLDSISNFPLAGPARHFHRIRLSGEGGALQIAWAVSVSSGSPALSAGGCENSLMNAHALVCGHHRAAANCLRSARQEQRIHLEQASGALRNQSGRHTNRAVEFSEIVDEDRRDVVLFRSIATDCGM